MAREIVVDVTIVFHAGQGSCVAQVLLAIAGIIQRMEEAEGDEKVDVTGLEPSIARAPITQKRGGGCLRAAVVRLLVRLLTWLVLVWLRCRWWLSEPWWWLLLWWTIEGCRGRGGVHGGGTCALVVVDVRVGRIGTGVGVEGRWRHWCRRRGGGRLVVSVVLEGDALDVVRTERAGRVATG